MNFDEMMKKMRVQYLENTKSKLSELETLIGEKDMKGLESFFHKLKGSGASYGLPEFSEFGARYELKAKNNNFEENELQNTHKELKALCIKHS